MAADAAGNDLGAVKVPRTGFAVRKLSATTPPTAAEIQSILIGTLPTGYVPLGLFKQDGGYAEEAETTEDLEFFQEGHKLPTGDDKLNFTLVLAETKDTASLELAGYAGDPAGAGGWREASHRSARGSVISDPSNGGINVVLVTEMDDGSVLARGGRATDKTVEFTENERGAITAWTIGFEWLWDETDGFFKYHIATAEEIAAMRGNPGRSLGQRGTAQQNEDGKLVLENENNDDMEGGEQR